MPRNTSSVTREKTKKVVKKLPSSETGPGVSCKTASGHEYIVSWCIEKMRFTLWRKVSDGYEQLATAKSPLDLYELVPWSK